MSREGFIESVEEGTRDAQMTIAGGLDLNLPPPEQNMDLSGTFVGSHSPEMQAQVRGHFQPQHVNNIQVIDDEISIISHTDFSEARKKRLRNRQIINENMGFHPGRGPMGNGYIIEGHGSYGPMPLPGEWIHVPISLAPLPSDICMNLQVTGTVQVNREKDVPNPKGVAGSLSCPICMSVLSEAATTKCGHVFCKPCIEAAIKAQHKCPNCRRKLKKNDIIRIYLPAPV